MIKVILETPYSGDTERNTKYARHCMKECLLNNESPLVSHLLYTQVLDDTIKLERKLGIQAGFIWREFADLTVVYTDYGISQGMKYGIDHSILMGIEVEYRELDNLEELMK